MYSEVAETADYAFSLHNTNMRGTVGDQGLAILGLKCYLK